MPSNEAIEAAKSIMYNQERIQTSDGLLSVTSLACMIDRVAEKQLIETDAKLLHAGVEIDIIIGRLADVNGNKELGYTSRIVERYKCMKTALILIAKAFKHQHNHDRIVELTTDDT